MVFLYLTVCLGSHDKQINKPTDSDGDAATAAADFPGPRQLVASFQRCPLAIGSSLPPLPTPLPLAAPPAIRRLPAGASQGQCLIIAKPR